MTSNATPEQFAQILEIVDRAVAAARNAAVEAAPQTDPEPEPELTPEEQRQAQKDELTRLVYGHHDRGRGPSPFWQGWDGPRPAA